MSRRLPPDLQHLILSYVPISQFAEFAQHKTNFWQRRLFTRYHQPPLVDTNIKKYYLLHALTEHSELYTDTTKLYNNIHYKTLCYYHAARAGNWGLVTHIAQKHFLLNSILELAIDANQLDVIRNIIAVQNDANISRGCCFSSEVTNLLFNQMLLLKESCWGLTLKAQLIAHLTLNDFKKLVNAYELYYFMESTIASIEHKPDSDKLDYLATVCSTAANYISLIYNKPLFNLSTNGIYLYHVIQTFADKTLINIADELDNPIFSSQGVTIFDFNRMRLLFSCLPNNMERATATIEILQHHLQQNPGLHSYIAVIKLLMQTLTVADVPHFDHVEANIIKILLQQQRYELIGQIDSGGKKFKLRRYIFTDVAALMCILNCKNISIAKSCSWIQIFSFPLLRQIIKDHPEKSKILITDLARYFIDIEYLIKLYCT